MTDGTHFYLSADWQRARFCGRSRFQTSFCFNVSPIDGFEKIDDFSRKIKVSRLDFANLLVFYYALDVSSEAPKNQRVKVLFFREMFCARHGSWQRNMAVTG